MIYEVDQDTIIRSLVESNCSESSAQLECFSTYLSVLLFTFDEVPNRALSFFAQAYASEGGSTSSPLETKFDLVYFTSLS